MRIKTILLYIAFFLTLLWLSEDMGGTYTFAGIVALMFLLVIFTAGYLEESHRFKNPHLQWLDKKI